MSTRAADDRANDAFARAVWQAYWAHLAVKNLDDELRTRRGLARIKRTLNQSARVIAELQEARKVDRRSLEEPMTI